MQEEWSLYWVILIAIILWLMPFLAINYRLFKKAGRPGWAAFVPIYGYVVYGRVGQAAPALALTCGILNLINLLSIIPPISLVMIVIFLFVGPLLSLAELGLSIYLFVKFIKQFRIGTWFWFLYVLVPIIAVFLAGKVKFSGTLSK